MSFCRARKASIQSSNVAIFFIAIRTPYHIDLCGKDSRDSESRRKNSLSPRERARGEGKDSRDSQSRRKNSLSLWERARGEGKDFVGMAQKIDWEGLIVGFESRSHQITHFFDRETGDVEQVLERDAARHAAMSQDPRYIALPRDQGERSRGDLEEFLGHCGDDRCRQALAAVLVGEESGRRYRETLMRFPTEEARFFQFKEHRALERAQAWLAQMGILFTKPEREM